MGSLIIGLLFIFIILIYNFIYKKRANKQTAVINEVTENLKKDSTKVNINLNDCEIKSSEYIEIIKHESRADATTILLGSLGGIEYEKTDEEISHNQCVLVYHWKDPATQHQKTFVSGIIDKDSDTLSFYLDKYKTTIIYFNPKNEDYFFDISFLEKGL